MTPSLFGKKRNDLPRSSEYTLRTDGGICRVDRHPDDLCEFYDENNVEWCLFAFSKKRFQVREMIADEACKRFGDRRFVIRIIKAFGVELELLGLLYDERVKRIKKAIPDTLDPEVLARTLRYAPVSDEEIQKAKGKVAILVRKDSLGTDIVLSREILEVERSL